MNCEQILFVFVFLIASPQKILTVWICGCYRSHLSTQYLGSVTSQEGQKKEYFSLKETKKQFSRERLPDCSKVLYWGISVHAICILLLMYLL